MDEHTDDVHWNEETERAAIEALLLKHPPSPTGIEVEEDRVEVGSLTK